MQWSVNVINFSSTHSLNFITPALQIAVPAPPTGISIALVLLAILLLKLMMVSAAESAFFALKPMDIEALRTSSSFNNQLIYRHISESDKLLATLIISEYLLIISLTLCVTFIVNESTPLTLSPIVKYIIDALIAGALVYLFGNVFPKIIALHHAHGITRLLAFPLIIARRLTWPIRKITISSSWLISRQAALRSKALSFDGLTQALELSNGELHEEKEIIEGIIKFSSLDVSEIMTPRVDVIDIDINTHFDQVLATIVESGYSRIPVFEESSDNIKGILYVKDLLVYLNRKEAFEWQSLIRKAYYIPETKKINDLLTEFQSRKLHMAIVVDEYGGTAGIVTLEDILEEIVGDISDEMDQEEVNFQKLADGSIIFEGKTLLEDFFDATEIEPNQFKLVEGDAETLAGLLLEIHGEIPQKGDIINYKSYRFTVLAADNRRIKKIKFHKPVTT